MLDITTAAYQNYENGRREAGYSTIAKLADFYGVTTDYLLGREPAQEPEFDYEEVKEKTDALINQIENLPPKYQDIMIKVLHMLREADVAIPLPEDPQSAIKNIVTSSDETECRQQETDTSRKDTA